MIRNILLILIILSIYSYYNKSIETSYYPNGILKTEKFKKNKLDFIVKEYFENGKIRSEYETYNNKDSSEYKFYNNNGILSNVDKYYKEMYSYTIDFFINGKIKAFGKYENGKPYGWFTYYDSINGLKISHKQFLILEDSSVAINQEIYFDNKGDTVKSKSCYFSIYSIKDTINIGEDYEFVVKLEAPYFKERMQVFVENLYDTTSLSIYDTKGFMVKCKVKPIKKGIQEVNGQIIDYRFLKEGEKSTSKYYNRQNNTEGRALFFDKKFYVR